MKILKEAPAKRGTGRVITIELDADEKILTVRDGQMLQLAYPLEDMVVSPDHVLEAAPVYWCVIEQKWMRFR